MLYQLTATEAARRIREGLNTSVELVTSCLDRIAESDPGIGAWAHLDRDLALAQAEAADKLRRHGRPLGPLHGVPVGIKDIFDTVDWPTECGTPVREGRRPEHDAAVITRLREAGAVIMGKTVTTEFAFLHPAATRNPHDPARTPGGSSSGSAAAVAAGHVPLAIGSQTNGSTIRPASFCGIYGFKPTRGLISRYGSLKTSETLDQVGVFGRSLEDVALLADALGGYDREDTASYARPRPRCLEGCRSAPPLEPQLVWFDLPFNDRLNEDAVAGLADVIDALGGQVERLEAPPSFADIVEHQQVIHLYEISRHLADEIANHWSQFSPDLQAVIERGQGYSDETYARALAAIESASGFLAQAFRDFDAVLTPSAAGEAPLISDGGTGDPVFCTIWTFCGLPAISLPLLVGASDLPIGVQLVGSAEGDDRLLRTASWLQVHLEQAETQAAAEPAEAGSEA